jgi:LPXTG-site transpeptidase (sortase) family protein
VNKKMSKIMRNDPKDFNIAAGLFVSFVFVVLACTVSCFVNGAQLGQPDEQTTTSTIQTTTTTLDAAAAREAQRQVWLEELKPGADVLELQYGAHHAGVKLGEVIILKLGVDSKLVQGSYSVDMSPEHSRGSVHWPESILPGMSADDEHEYGSNCLISGHRTIKPRPFNRLDELVAGDEVILRLPYATIYYSVLAAPKIVEIDEVQLAMQGENLLYLSACHPKGSATQRILVACEMVGVELAEPSK